MSKENLSWETTFNTAENLMIHTFSDRIKVVSNIETGLSKILRDGNVINSVNNPAITEYEKFLKQVAEDANKLKEFSTE
jgi:hypothetical protein|nr:MAG TPA: hypothetical protein [Caudoviricetes sp.]